MTNRIDTEALLELAVSLGYHLQMCGSEIYRTEEAVQRLLTAYGVPGDVFAIPHCLIVTVCPDDMEPMTRMRRIGSHGTDIDGIERFYGLARQLCAEKPPLAEAEVLLQEAKRQAGRVLWLNPIPENKWKYIRSIQAMASICPMISCSTLRELAAACRRLAQN